MRCVFCGVAMERVPAASCDAAWGVCLGCLPGILRSAGTEAGTTGRPHYQKNSEGEVF